jgi:hypothetical protein
MRLSGFSSMYPRARPWCRDWRMRWWGWRVTLSFDRVSALAVGAAWKRDTTGMSSSIAPCTSMTRLVSLEAWAGQPAAALANRLAFSDRRGAYLCGNRAVCRCRRHAAPTPWNPLESDEKTGPSVAYGRKRLPSQAIRPGTVGAFLQQGNVQLADLPGLPGDGLLNHPPWASPAAKCAST